MKIKIIYTKKEINDIKKNWMIPVLLRNIENKLQGNGKREYVIKYKKNGIILNKPL
jgi:hypothetical protein